MMQIARRLAFPLPLLCLALFFAPAVASAAAEQPATRPNILWLTAEDMSPHVG